jgi:hypothetical protein
MLYPIQQFFCKRFADNFTGFEKKKRAALLLTG